MSPRVRQAMWFGGLWLASVAAVGALAMLVKLVLQQA